MVWWHRPIRNIQFLGLFDGFHLGTYGRALCIFAHTPFALVSTQYTIIVFLQIQHARFSRVEFQSKFYSGLGHGFQPFSFELILDSSQAGDD